MERKRINLSFNPEVKSEKIILDGLKEYGKPSQLIKHLLYEYFINTKNETVNEPIKNEIIEDEAKADEVAADMINF